MNKGSISYSLIKTILDTAEQKGVNRSKLLNNLVLEKETLIDPSSRVSLEKVIELFQIIIEETGDQLFGLHVGENVKPGSLNALGYALMSSQNVYEAYQLQKTFGGVIADCGELSLRKEGAVCYLEFTVMNEDMELVAPLNEMFMAMFWEYCQWITQGGGELIGVNFTHISRDNSLQYQRVFRVKPKFLADSCSLVFDAKYLSSPLVQADTDMNVLMKQKTESLYLNGKSNASLHILVVQQIQKYMPLQKATLTFVASSLNMSERSLARKLKLDGHSFKSILLNVRESMALGYLKNIEHSVTEIANLLGYRDYSAFSHAFRVWTGYSPTEYRDRLENGRYLSTERDDRV